MPKHEELIREFLDLPPEGQAEVVDLIEFLRSRHRTRDPNGTVRSLNLAEEGFVGMWKDREDMQDSSAWVRNAREREWVKHG